MSKKRVFLIIILVIVILGGFLGFVYYYLNKGVTPTPEKIANTQNLFPFGNGPTNSATSTLSGNNSNAYQTANSGSIPNLRQISIVPTAGAIAFSTGNGSTTAIRYTERGTGHIYQATSNSLNQTRISNITVPKIYEALWIKNDSFIIRYANDDESSIESYSGQVIPIRNATSTQLVDAIQTTIAGNFISKDIKQISVSPKKDLIFYDGIISKIDGTKKVEIFNSPFKNWLSQWFSDNNILITTKPSGESFGYAYFLNTKTGKYDKVMGEIRGLTTLANVDGSKILYSQSDQNDFSIGLYTVKTAKKEALLLKTFPEKCVWGNAVKTDIYCANPTFSKQAEYPDDWYKGKVHFSDDIWKLDTLTGELTQLAKLKDLTNQEIDVVNLSLDEKDNYLIFINKNDLTLWSLKVK